MTLRRVLVAWTSLAGLGWLISWAIAANNEADCNEATSLFCFDQEAIGVITALYVGAAWLTGLGVIGLVAALVWRIRTMSNPP
jgi:hypothetical protein